MPTTLSQADFEAKYGKQNSSPSTISGGQFNQKYGLPSHAGANAIAKSAPLPKVSVGKEFLKQLIPATAQTILGGPAKLFASTGEGIVQTFKTGGKSNATDQTYKLPGLAPFKSFQSDATDRAKQGQNPVLNAGQATLGTAGAGLDTLAFVDAASGAKNLVSNLADKKAISGVWDTIKPELGKINSTKAGMLEETGIGKAATVKPNQEMITAATPYVKDAKTPLQAVTNMQAGIAEKGDALQKALKDTKAIYTKSQVQGAFNKIEPSADVVGDTAKIYDKVKAKALSLVGNGGTLDKLLQARKDFDAYINSSFPNLYDSDRLSGIKKAVLDIRGSLNDVIESRLPDGKLPDGTTFRASLNDQKLLYQAIDNTAPKIKVGAPTTLLGKISSGLGSNVKKVAAGAVTYEGAKKIFTGNW
jgi:hypothetical protein